jgi:hypothetical protein
MTEKALYTMRDCMVEAQAIMDADETKRKYLIAKTLNTWRNAYEKQIAAKDARILELESGISGNLERNIAVSEKLISLLEGDA